MIAQASDEHELQQRMQYLVDQQTIHGVGPLWTAPFWIETLLDTMQLWNESYQAAKEFEIPIVVLHAHIFR